MILNILLFCFSLILFNGCRNKSEFSGKAISSEQKNSTLGSNTSLADEILNDSETSNLSDDAARKKQIYDSLNITNKENNFAYALTSSLNKNEAIEAYKKILRSGISSLYIFRTSKNENFIVQYEGKGDGELALNMPVLKYQLDGYDKDAVKIIDLTDEDYCTKGKTINKITENDKDLQIQYIVCQ